MELLTEQKQRWGYQRSRCTRESGVRLQVALMIPSNNLEAPIETLETVETRGNARTFEAHSLQPDDARNAPPEA